MSTVPAIYGGEGVEASIRAARSFLASAEGGQGSLPPLPEGCLLREGGNVGNLPRKSIKASMS